MLKTLSLLYSRHVFFRGPAVLAEKGFGHLHQSMDCSTGAPNTEQSDPLVLPSGSMLRDSLFSTGAERGEHEKGGKAQREQLCPRTEEGTQPKR